MRILHTADWHIGHSLNGWSRDEEHRLWFDSLAEFAQREAVDALLVSGDVFDGINPSGASQRIFYAGLRQLKDRCPHLVTVLTSGNHDPAARLEAPAAILASLDVHVRAVLRRTDTGAVDIAHHMIPLPDRQGIIRAQVCALPFLRAADMPGLSFADEAGGSSIVAAAGRLHAEIAEAAQAWAGTVPVIAMGHLHARGGEESEGAERSILIGGEHALPVDVFPETFAYVALGHLHRPQSLAGGRVRYCGSCFPLSAAEIGYDHGVTVIDLDDGGVRVAHHNLPRPAEMIRLPRRGAMPIDDLGPALAQIAVADDLPPELRPFVYVELEATGPAAVVLSEAEKLLAAHPVRPAGVRIRRTEAAAPEALPQSLAETTPETLFRAQFQKTQDTAPEARHIAAFRDALAEV